MTSAPRPPVREIVLATDFSDASEPAGRVAREYARAFGARVHLLHVASPATLGATSLMTDLAASFAPTPTVVRVLGHAAPAAAIVRYAATEGIDLIVLGTHGRSGVSRVLLGSVADRVARTAPCPVLTVPAGAGHAAPEAETAEPEALACLVCAQPSDDLICESCRARIRGEALEAKHREERAGRA